MEVRMHRKARLSKRTRQLGIIALVFVVSMMALDAAGRESPIFSPLVWGTFGDWASAVFPALTILVTMEMWISDGDDKDQARLLALQSQLNQWIRDLAGLRLERRTGLAGPATWVTNQSNLDVEVLATPQSWTTARLPVAKGGAVALSQLGWEEAFVFVDGMCFQITDTGPQLFPGHKT